MTDALARASAMLCCDLLAARWACGAPCDMDARRVWHQLVLAQIHDYGVLP